MGVDIERLVNEQKSVIKYSIDSDNIAYSYGFIHIDGVGLVLHANTQTPKKLKERKTTKPQISYTTLYQDFLRVLAPFSDHLIPPNKWSDMLDTESTYFQSNPDKHVEVIKAVAEAIIEHASIYGFGYTNNRFIQKAVLHNLKDNHGVFVEPKYMPLFIEQTSNTDPDNPRHFASLSSIVLLALDLYESLSLTGKELLEDDVLIDLINQNKPNLELGEHGAVINVEGYFGCLFWSFIFDRKRLSASKCICCSRPIIAYKSAKWCSTKCRSSLNNARRRLRRLIKEAEDMKQGKERTKIIKNLKKALDSMEIAMKLKEVK